MLRVDNRKVMSDLAGITYRANKKRNIFTIAAIFLTTFLICAVISVGLCYRDTLALRQQRMEGADYDVEMTEPRDDQIEAVRKMDGVKHAGLRVKCAILSAYQEKILDKVQLFLADDICWKEQIIPALDYYTGAYPKKENELMLSKSALASMGIKDPRIGMELSLVYQPLSDSQVNEEKTETFVLSGWFLDYTGRDTGYVSEDFYMTTGAKATDLTQGELMISLKDPLYTEKDIINMQNQIGLSGTQIIEADYDTISNFCKTTIGLFALLLLIFLSGYLFIYNTLYISVNRDIRYYGQLKTIGTTSVQIRKIIYRQMIRNAAAGIPLGLTAAAVLGKIIIPQTIHALNPVIEAGDVKATSPWVFVTAAVFSFAVTMISSQKPAKIAIDSSPVEAMRYTGARSVKVKSRKRRGGDIRSMVKINLLRDKKQFFVVMCSLSLALSLFQVVNVIIQANDAEYILNHFYGYDLRLLNQTLLSEKEEQVFTTDLIREIEAVDGVKDVRVLKSATACVPYQEDVYGAYYKELYQSRYTPGNYEKDIQLYKEDPTYYVFTCRIVGVDDLEFEKINQTVQNPLDKEKFKAGEVAFVSKTFTSGDDGISGKTVSFSVPTAIDPDKIEKIETGPVTGDYPAYYSAGYTPDLIVSTDYLDRMVEEPLIEMIKIDYDEPFSKDTEAAVKRLTEGSRLISADSKLDRYKEMKNSENQITVLGGSIGIIVMLLAVSNYVNMMSAGIENRLKEFAILESIGMTRKQLKTMIVWESVSYVVLSVAVSVMTGLPVSYAVFTNFNRYRIPFHYPILENVIVFLFILAVCIISSLLVFSRSKCETIIELLRRDEVTI